jgi:hypothetical protein
MADAKKALQTEVVAVKTRWGSEAKLQKAAADSPKAPLPLAVSRTIPRPDVASMYDVEELTVRLWIDDLEIADESAPPVRVEVAGVIPDVLQAKIACHVLQRWQAELRARGAGKGWLLEKVLAWAEGAYVDLLNLEPSLVEVYDGCNDEGMTIRRYAIAEPPPPPGLSAEGAGEEESESESEEEDDEVQRMARLQLEKEEERKRRIQEKSEAEADRLYREERRREAEEAMARGDDQGAKPLSKKEQDKLREEKANSQGKRLRKQGAKANKFDAEAAGKTTKSHTGKNKLLH